MKLIETSFFRIIILTSLLLFGFFSLAMTTQAASETQAQCFSTLKENMKEAGVFGAPLWQLASTTYAEITPKFSKKYKKLSSFGIEVNKGVFEMRAYGFGRPTGFVYPPYLPFPTYDKSERWQQPFNEFNFVEEYTVDPQGESHFTDCLFLSIQSKDLTKVTRENYAYDGSTVSLIKVARDKSYKARYNAADSFDHQGSALAYWQRLFVYPKTTQNEYFNKYDIVESYPAHLTKSFAVLSTKVGNIITIEDRNSTSTPPSFKYMKVNASGKLVDANYPEALKPIQLTEINDPFPLTEYYQAIEARFPEFAKLLSIHGTLKFDTFKNLLIENADPSAHPEIRKVLDTLLDYTTLSAYTTDKVNKKLEGIDVYDEDMENMLFATKDADWAIGQLSKDGVTLNNLKDQKGKKEGLLSESLTAFIVIVFGLLLVILPMIFLRKHFTKIN